MAKTVKTAEEVASVASFIKTRSELFESVQKLKQITIDGVFYLGEISKQEGSITMKNAVDITDCANLDSAIKTWIKAQNVDKLEEIELGGMISYTTKNFTEDQLDEIEMACIIAAKAFKTAIPGLINGAF